MEDLRALGSLYPPPGSKLAVGIVTPELVKTLKPFEVGRVERQTESRDVIVL
jgi:hypothetical protein